MKKLTLYKSVSMENPKHIDPETGESGDWAYNLVLTEDGWKQTGIPCAYIYNSPTLGKQVITSGHPDLYHKEDPPNFKDGDIIKIYYYLVDESLINPSWMKDRIIQ